MAPLKPGQKDGVNARLQAVIDKAENVATLLRDREPIPEKLQAELENIMKIPLPTPFSSISCLPMLDSLGCDIWNSATNMIRATHSHGDTQGHGENNQRTAVILRVFAFLLVDAAYHLGCRRQKDRDKLIRTFKLGLKACRHCLDNAEMELAMRVLERCGEYATMAEDDSPVVKIAEPSDDNEDRATLKSLVSEFHLMRMMHAWKTDRLDIAEQVFGNLAKSQLGTSPQLAEKAADLFSQIGKSLHKKKLQDPAISWARRALDVLSTFDVEHLSPGALELRLSICATYVECLVSLKSRESLRQAESLLQELDQQCGTGNRIAVLLMHLRVFLASEQVNQEKVREVASRVVHSAVFTEPIFKTIMKSIHRIEKTCPLVAYLTLGELITDRLLPDLTIDEDDEHTMLEWVEKSCVTYTLFVTGASGEVQHSAIDWLADIYSAIARATQNQFSPRAAHACQALIWKAAGAAHPEMANRLFDMLRNPLFSGAGQANKAKIGRKAMNTAILEGDLDRAREIFFQMPVAAQNESMTRYLAFKLALASNDYQLATESLDIVMKQSDRDPTPLYGCVLEAQQSQMRRLAVTALQAMIEKAPPTVHFPSLLRCTAKLLVGELGSQERSVDEVFEEVLRLFECAASSKQVLNGGNMDQWRAEIQWWSKNAYNLALEHCAHVPPEQLVRMLRVCTKLIGFCLEDAGPAHDESLKRREMLCHFIVGTALVVLGRSHPEGSEDSLQSYLEARREIERFLAVRSRMTDGNDDEIKTTQHRILEMLKLDLECILNLQQWDQLDAALKLCLDLKNIDRWDRLADIVLIIQRKISGLEIDSSPHTRLTEVLQRVINDTWKKEKDMVKCSRWLRISFASQLDQGNASFALKLLTQASSMVKKGYDTGIAVFPEPELQWLSTTAFNHAVDLLTQGRMEACSPWIENALGLARYSADNGALHASLTEKKRLFEERMKERRS